MWLNLLLRLPVVIIGNRLISRTLRVRAVSQKTNGEYLLYKAGKSTTQINCVHVI